MHDINDKIEAAFADVEKYEHFLLDDVGLVHVHHFGPRKHQNWGLIETINGRVRFFSKHVCQWLLYDYGMPYPALHPKVLPVGQPVTFSAPTTSKEGLHTYKVCIWEPERFATLKPTKKKVYRLVERRATRGGLGSEETMSGTKRLWVGHDIQHASRRWPIERYPVTKWRYWEERVDGAWKVTEDPRTPKRKKRDV